MPLPQAKKALGQNFLTDKHYLARIVAAIAPQPGQHILEIGPGAGALTTELLAAGAHVTVVEKDTRCLPILEALGAQHAGRLTIHAGDVLKLNLADLVPAGSQLVGNLPYNIGTEIVIRALDADAFSRMVFLLQKEVVARICGIPSSPDWGRLGVYCQWLADCRPLLDVPPGAFTPAPKVTSSLVELLPLAQPRYVAHPKKLQRLTQQAFGQRRKMLRASLKGMLNAAQIEAAGIDPTSRPEDLSLEALCRLSHQLP